MNTPKITSVLTDILGQSERVIGVNSLERLEYAAHAAWTEAETAALDAFPTDPQAGGPYVMWKGTPYAHIMVPIGERPAR